MNAPSLLLLDLDGVLRRFPPDAENAEAARTVGIDTGSAGSSGPLEVPAHRHDGFGTD